MSEPNSHRQVVKSILTAAPLRELMRRPREQILFPPGSLVHIGRRRQESTRISVTSYDAQGYEFREDVEPEGLDACLEPGRVTWVNIDGLHDVQRIAAVGERFGLHPLTLEDIVHTDGRPKFEDHHDYLLLILKSLFYREDDRSIVVDHVSIVVAGNVVLSFREAAEGLFEAVRVRIEESRGRIRTLGADYLAYALADVVVDNYYPTLDAFRENIDRLDEALLKRTRPGLLQEFQRLRREAAFLRRSITPAREVASEFERCDSPMIGKQTRAYLRDLRDHAFSVVEAVDLFRELLTGTLEIYLSRESNRMNEIMKVLTIIATIFIPLTFLAGIYGMNFQHMPELSWRWAYPAFWGVILVVAGALLIFFRRKFWL
jgi:magnesium transporter